MKNSYLVVGVILLVAAGFGGFLILNQKSTPSPINTNNKASTSTDDLNSEGRYIVYSKENLENASTRRVLYFYANWCPTCRPADADLKANESKIPEDVTVIRVNYNDSDTDNEEKALASKYGVTYQHTYVQIDSTGKAVTKWNGGGTDELLANLK